MDVSFRFEKKKAQIILSPTGENDNILLQMVRRYGTKIITFSVDNNKELVIEAEGADIEATESTT